MEQKNKYVPASEAVIDLGVLIRVLLKRVWVIVLAAVLVFVLTYVGGRIFVTPKYQAKFTAYALNINSGKTEEIMSSSNITASQKMAANFVEIINGSTFLEVVIQEAGLPFTVEELNNAVTASVPDDSQNITVSVVMEDAEDALAVASAIEERAHAYVTEKTGAGYLRIIDSAYKRAGIYSPDYLQTALLAAVLVAMLLVMAVVLYEIITDKVRNRSFENRFGVPVIGEIPSLERRSLLRKKTDDGDYPEKIMDAGTAEEIQAAYQLLRTNVAFSFPGNESRCVGITSAESGEGKGSVLLNLAMSYAQIGKRVLVVDADLRQPSVAEELGIQVEQGLSDVLIGKATFREVLRALRGVSVHVLPAGTVPPDPTKLLDSSVLQQVMDNMKQYYDYVLVNLPPVVGTADASILSKYIDGVVAVVGDNTARMKMVTEMMAQLDRAGANVIGFVYNNVEQ